MEYRRSPAAHAAGFRALRAALAPTTDMEVPPVKSQAASPSL
jgi:hypothetical protein